MPNILKLTLDESTTPWSVDVAETGNANHVSRSASWQTLTWNLESNAATGEIVSFTWLTKPGPPLSILGPFEISGNGKQATMADLNNSAGTTGTWTYQLTIEVDGEEFSTIADLSVGTNTNPSIKNT